MELLYSLQKLFIENPLGQTFGFIAMGVGVLGYLVKNDKTTIKIFIVSCIFWIIHFFYLGNYGALIATAIGVLRLVLSLKYQKNISVFLGIVAISIAYGIYSFDGKLISTLPLLATAISSYGFFFLEKMKLRLLLALVSLMWLIYHTQSGSISGLLNEIFVQITIWYSIFMFATGHEKREKILERFRRKIGKGPARLNFGRYIFFRDKDRFD